MNYEYDLGWYCCQCQCLRLSSCRCQINHQNMSSQALASLTATYTDSEAEEDPEDDNTNQGSVTLTTPNGSPTDSKSTPSSRPQSPVVKVTAKRQQLVSYHDDTIVSDDEGETEKHQIVIISENESLEKNELETVEGELFTGF